MSEKGRDQRHIIVLLSILTCCSVRSFVHYLTVGIFRQSECSWEIVGPCDVASADEACAGGTLFLDGGAPYYKNYNEVCGGTEVPTPLSVDDIPDETTCVAGTDHYLLALSDSYGDGWLVLSISIYTTRTASTGLVNNNRFHNLSFQIQNKGMTMC